MNADQAHQAEGLPWWRNRWAVRLTAATFGAVLGWACQYAPLGAPEIACAVAKAIVGAFGAQ